MSAVARARAAAVAAAMGAIADDLTVTVLHPELEALGVDDFRRYRITYVVDAEPLYGLPIPVTGGPVDLGLPYGCRCYVREVAEWGDVLTPPPDGCPRHRLWQLEESLPGVVTWE